MEKDKGDIMNAVQIITGKTITAPSEMASLIAKEAPRLADLSAEQLKAVAGIVVRDRLARDLDRKADLAGIDYQAEKRVFLSHAGRTQSEHTRKAYTSALARLEEYARRHSLNVLEIRGKEADDYAYALAAERRAPASIRRDIAAASSFFTWLERRHDSIRNPFRGTKARPPKKAARPAAYPTDVEAEKIIAELAPDAKAAVLVLSLRGLRAGALESLIIRDGRFKAQSKGKEISGELPAEVLKAIKSAKLDGRRPFEGWNAQKITDAIRWTARQLNKAGQISAVFTAHDFRHLFAVREYRKDHDLYRVSKLLGHASIQITELYLKGLGEVD
jgi:integrase